MDSLWQDVKFGARMLARNRAITIIAALTLALGIGATTTIYSWVYATLLRGFPGVPQQDRVVVIGGLNQNNEYRNFSFLDYQDFRDRNQAFEGISVMSMVAVNLSEEASAERIWGLMVSGNYFDVLRVRPILGRTFLPDEDRVPLEKPVVVLGHGLWQQRFAGDPNIVGKQISVNSHAFTVIGVAPAEFQGTFIGLNFQAYFPIMMQRHLARGATWLDDRSNHWLEAVGRLNPGINAAQAENNLNVLLKQLDREYPGTSDTARMAVYSPWSIPYGSTPVVRPVFVVLMSVVGVVLLIACANVAGLLLARSSARRREIAIRMSLGAGRARLLRQLLTESLLLASLGGLGGILIAVWSQDLIWTFTPPMDFPIALTHGLNQNVLLFALGISVATGLLFGVAPAADASRKDVIDALKSETGTLAGAQRRGHLRHALVIAQVTLSLVLLVCAGLLLQSMKAALAVNPGFNPHGILLAGIDLFPGGYSPKTGQRFFGELVERLNTLPSVESASLVRRVPLGFGGTSTTGIRVEGYQPAPNEIPRTHYNLIAPRYFRTMQIPILMGREFSLADTDQAPLAVVVNETFAQQFCAGREALGRRVRVWDNQWATIIGVARNSIYSELKEGPRPVMYASLLQFYRPDATILVRATGNPESVAPSVRSAVQSLDPNLPIFVVRTFERHAEAATFQQRMAASLLSGFGMLGMFLAAIGLYGVLAYNVAQRTREIGIRMALGARPANILRMVISSGMEMVGTGILAGIVISLLTTRFLTALLVGVGPRDPWTLIAVVVLLAGIATAACWIPARRAARIEPMTALRYE
jgi:predicted permease